MAESRASQKVFEWLGSASPDGHRTQEDLAGRLSAHVGRAVNQSTVSLIARGLQQPRADLIAAFAVELGIKVEDWLPIEPVRKAG